MFVNRYTSFQFVPNRVLANSGGNMGAHNFSYVFKFEQEFDEPKFDKYMKEHWGDCFVYSFIYVLVVFGTKRWMEKRPRYDLRPYLAVWSSILAVFSIFGTIRTLPELITALKYHGLEYTICNKSYFEGVTAFWCATFTLSKVVELGDTLFIVLRKQNLIFLHWYHHITVLMYVWYSYPGHGAPFGRWFMCMNFLVHSVMYSYYALKAMRLFAVPKFVSMFITFLQIAQMIIGCTVTYWAYTMQKENRIGCHVNKKTVDYGMLMYLSYFALFSHFFYNAYIAPRTHQIPSKKRH